MAPAHWREPFVLVVIGQSNAANHGTPQSRAGDGTYALGADGLYRLEDPLPGASGSGGSPWPYWAALQRQANPKTDVVLASIAQGSSAVADWIPGGSQARRLDAIGQELRRQGLSVSAVLWHQGETEAWSGADAATYAKNLQSWITSVRNKGIKAPIYICLTSRDDQGVINPAIRLAQASVWSRSNKVFAGADTDSLGDSFRSDGVHFNQQGLEAFARMVEVAMSHPNPYRAVTYGQLSHP